MSSLPSEPEFEQAYKGNNKIIVRLVGYTFPEIRAIGTARMTRKKGGEYFLSPCRHPNFSSKRLWISPCPWNLDPSQIIFQFRAQVGLWFIFYILFIYRPAHFNVWKLYNLKICAIADAFQNWLQPSKKALSLSNTQSTELLSRLYPSRNASFSSG